MKVFTQLACGESQIGPIKVAKQSKYEEEQYQVPAYLAHYLRRVDLPKTKKRQTRASTAQTSQLDQYLHNLQRFTPL